MREIKFRGKRIDNGEWVYGYYLHTNQFNVHTIFNQELYRGIWLDRTYIVDPNTIGQYTGLKDRNGRDIYEGDFVKIIVTNWWQGHKIEKIQYKYAQVSLHEKTNEIQFKEKGNRWWITMSTLFRPSDELHYIEIIGNIHEGGNKL